jgi:polyisoprenyl-phosphate glycosyltransferase
VDLDRHDTGVVDPALHGTCQCSVVIPVYNAAESLQELHARLSAVLYVHAPDYEIVFIDDASPDDSWRVLKELRARDTRVRIIQLMRNVGQTQTTLCGIEHARGQVVVTVDDDLQQPPEEIPKLLSALSGDPDVDVVIAAFANKRHSRLRNVGTNLLRSATAREVGATNGLQFTSFRAMDRSVARELVHMSVRRPRITVMLFLITRRIINVQVEHQVRKYGASGYTKRALFRLGMDHVLNTAVVPFWIVTTLGILCLIIGGAIGIRFFVTVDINEAFFTIQLLWATLMLLFGTLFVVLGAIGEYIMRVYRETGETPKPIIREIGA